MRIAFIHKLGGQNPCSFNSVCTGAPILTALRNGFRSFRVEPPPVRRMAPPSPSGAPTRRWRGVTSAPLRTRDRPAFRPGAATGSYRRGVSCDDQHYLAFFGTPRGIANGLHDILAFKVRIIGRNFLDAVPRADLPHDMPTVIRIPRRHALPPITSGCWVMRSSCPMCYSLANLMVRRELREVNRWASLAQPKLRKPPEPPEPREPQR